MGQSVSTAGTVRALGYATQVLQVVNAGNSTCELLTNGRVQCYGDNYYAELGQGFKSQGPMYQSLAPVLVPGLEGVIQISAGESYYCALENNGLVACWGYSFGGQANGGYASPNTVLSPSIVQNLDNVVRLVTGGSFACAIKNSGEVFCWGLNLNGQLAQGTDGVWQTLPPVRVANIENPLLLVLGYTHACVQLSDFSVLCWGENGRGAVGSGSASYSLHYPTLIANPGSELLSMSLGIESSCFVTRDHLVSCWGANEYGQSGTGSTATYVATPTVISELSDIKSVSAGYWHFCASTLAGRVYCWGSNQGGQLGLSPSTIAQSYVPVPVPSISEVHVVRFLQGSHSSVFATTSTGAIYAWGSNQKGELGLGYTTPYQTGVRPTLVTRSELAVPASAPSISSSALSDSQVTVNFALPITNGGSEILNYEYSTDGGSTWSAASPAQTSSPLIISGLTNGTSYSVKIRAVNSIGSGAESDAVSVKPVAPATAPTISGVTAGNGQATLSITAPSQINDSSLSGYDYSTNNGSTWSSFPSATGPFTITGLTNATAYQVKVRAVNSAGAGEASSAVTVNPTRLVPAKPVIASVVGGNASVTVNITNPADVTAQSITGYQYSIDKGATYQNAVVSNGSFTISGLTNGVSTSVQIRATNFNGTSLPSVAKSVIPATTPDAPSISRITRSAGALSIAFTAPKTGGSAITSYHYSLDGGLTWVVPKTAVKSSPIRVTGLPNATTYQVSIRAVNGKGISMASTAVSATTPVVVPSSPVYTSITKTRTTIIIEFEAPVNDGGGTITNYAYSTDSGRTWVIVSPASNSTRVVITGLNPSTLYPVQLAAINSAGRGASSALTRVGTLH